MKPESPDALAARWRLAARGIVACLFGQNQLAQLGGLQTVDGAVVQDGNSLGTLQQLAALQGARRLVVLGRGYRAWLDGCGGSFVQESRWS